MWLLAIGRAVTLAEIVPWFSVFDHGFLTTTKDTNLWRKSGTHDRISTRAA